VSKSVRKNKFTMNRRQLVSRAASLMPGGALFRGHAVTPPPPTVLDEYSRDDPAVLRASQNTEEVVMELLQQCLERIGWQGKVSDWHNRLDHTLDRIGSLLTSKTDPLPVLITGYQLDCLGEICRFASAGDEAQTLLSALLLCDAFLPFNHWVEDGFIIGKHNKLNELAHRHPEAHALLGSAMRRIPQQELNQPLPAESPSSPHRYCAAYHKEVLKEMMTML
jgi:hypothetical protein